VRCDTRDPALADRPRIDDIRAMRLTLLRHGVAVEKDEWDGDDADRPLTKEGANEVRALCRAVRRVVDAHEIWTSPWARARATAEIAAMVWKLPLREVPWLAGDGCPPRQAVAQLLPKLDVVLVGHEPDLGRIAGLLVGLPALPLTKGGVAVLKGEPRPQGMELKMLLTPRQAQKIGNDD
jgi:phosphohistidine phosphatase